MMLHDAAGQRKAEARTVSFGSIKKTKEVGEV
jgi:hypothetical protein